MPNYPSTEPEPAPSPTLVGPTPTSHATRGPTPHPAAPPGIITAGFSFNGVWSAAFNRRASPEGATLAEEPETPPPSSVTAPSSSVAAPSSAGAEGQGAEGEGGGGGCAEWEGTIFLIAYRLREMCTLFKLLCDVSGRLESASRANVVRYMRRGRNLALIPGGVEVGARGKLLHACSWLESNQLIETSFQIKYIQSLSRDN